MLPSLLNSSKNQYHTSHEVGWWTVIDIYCFVQLCTTTWSGFLGFACWSMWQAICTSMLLFPVILVFIYSHWSCPDITTFKTWEDLVPDVDALQRLLTNWICCTGENCYGWKVHWLVWFISLCVEGECPVKLLDAVCIVSYACPPLRCIKDALCYVSMDFMMSCLCSYCTMTVKSNIYMVRMVPRMRNCLKEHLAVRDGPMVLFSLSLPLGHEWWFSLCRCDFLYLTRDLHMVQSIL